jgi:hypothetical protein
MKDQKGWNPGKINRQQDRSSPILPDHVVPSGHCLYKIYSFRTTSPFARTSHLIWVCTWVHPGTTLKDNETHMIWFSYFVFFELGSSIRLVQMCHVFWYDRLGQRFPWWGAVRLYRTSLYNGAMLVLVPWKFI